MAFNGGKDITSLGPPHFFGVFKLYFLTMPKYIIIAKLEHLR
jgi:hypothetical protein